MSAWALAGLGVVDVVVALVAFRWLARLQARTEDHAERIAHLEGERNGRGR